MVLSFLVVFAFLSFLNREDRVGKNMGNRAKSSW